jgi:putative transcriptional regulator
MDFSGKLLIAPPTLKSTFWHKSVIMVTEDHTAGTIGVMLNKRSQLSVNDFAQELGMTTNIPGFVYLGGPVDLKAMSMLHTNDWTAENTLVINDQFSVSSSNDMLPRLSDGDAPSQFRIFLGLCVWAPGQLESEYTGSVFQNHNLSWLTATPDHEMVFDHELRDQWVKAIDRSAQEFCQSILD